MKNAPIINKVINKLVYVCLCVFNKNCNEDADSYISEKMLTHKLDKYDLYVSKFIFKSNICKNIDSHDKSL